MIDRTGYEHLLPQPTEGVITTTVIAEREVGPDPDYQPPGQTRANIIPVPVYGREGGAFMANWGDADAHGNTFAAASTGLVENNNITWVEFRYAPSRQPLGQDVAWRVDPIWKIDTFKCWPAVRDDNPDMADIIVFLTTHTIGQPTRRIYWEFAVIPNVWHYSVADQHLSRGGPGALRGGALQEVDVTPEEVVDAFAAALGDAGHPLTRGFARTSQEGTRKALVSPEVDPFVVDEGELNARVQQAFTGGGDFYTGHGVYARFTETTYEQVRKLLVEAGLLPPPPPEPEKPTEETK